MSENIFRKIKKDEKNKQTNAIYNGMKIYQKCAGCGEKNPEYVLEDRQLCSDCYRTERHYCDKELT